jgi:hypothetical protein
MLENLKKSIQLNPALKAQAKTTSWLENFKDDEDFKKLIE